MKKKILAMILAFALVLPLCPVFELPLLSLPVSAATSGTTGDCTWTLDGTTLTISGNGKMGDYTFRYAGGTYATTAPWGTSVTAITIEDGVTTIGEYAFSGCSAITSVTIGGNITAVGKYAFYKCSSISAITLLDSVTSIGEGAFDGCNGLSTITLPFVGEKADGTGNTLFAYIFGTTSNGCVNGQYYFNRAVPESLKSVVITGGTAIGEHAFEGCTNLVSITIPDSVTILGKHAFYNCWSLPAITLPDNVTSIGEHAFSGCSALTDIWYEGSEVDRASISIDSFNNILTSATWHYNSCIKNEGVWTHVYNDVCSTECNLCGFVRTAPHIFDNACDADCNECGFTRTVPAHVYDNEVDASCNVCGTERTLPYDAYGTTGDCIWYLKGTVLTISGNGAMGDYSYYQPWMNWSSSITKVVIENGVTIIGSTAFSYFYSLTSVTIPNSVTSIGWDAFFFCRSLQSIEIAGSVNYIASGAFMNCDKLTTVYYGGKISDKNKISIEEEGNALLLNATWVYIPCDIHIYDNACDTDCNECDEERAITHDYSVRDQNETEHWMKCSVCEIVDENSFAPHIHDNACDTDCNVCGFTRTITHDFSIQDKDAETHWMKCSVCGVIDETTRTAHIHDNACDTSCNACGMERQVPDHVYTNACDSTCNVCGEVRTVLHQYDNTEDLTCNLCGHERPPYTPGDVDGVEGVTSDDAIYLLYHTLLGSDRYPLNQPGDFNKDGKVDSDDAIYLLYHTLLGGDRYPLS